MTTTALTRPRRYTPIRIVDVSAAHTRNRTRADASRGKARPVSSLHGRRKVVAANIVRLIPGQTRLPFEASSY
jgi:hypothetical protein